MPELGRAQLIVYAAVGIALLIVGGRWLRSASAATDSASPGTVASGASSGGGSGSSGFSVGAATNEDVVVDVTGAVRRSGVYRLPAGSRVEDALARAGGPTDSAEVESINLAARLSDGQQVTVPDRAKSPVGVGDGTSAGSTSSVATDTAPISLGSATLEQLDTIDGIGPVTAQQIIDFRDQHGGVSSIDELDQISGIGPATMETLRARLQP